MDDFNGHGVFQPEEYFKYYAPARDEVGLPISPEFEVHFPWLADRRCQLSLRSYIESEDGERAGVSLYVVNDIEMIGASNTGVFIDNETSLNVGDHVCIEDDNRLNTTDCAVADSLFTVRSIDAVLEPAGQVMLEMTENVVTASAYGSINDVLEASISADALISFDGISDGRPASCGQVDSPNVNTSSCNSTDIPLQAVFSVSEDGSEMSLLLQDAYIEGPVNEQGNIMLTEPGYYSIIRFGEFGEFLSLIHI